MSTSGTPETRHILEIRTLGQDLVSRSTPVYDLSHILLAVQQMVHKVYVYQYYPERFGNRLALSHAERQRLALRLRTHSPEADGPGCDLYGLTTFLSEPHILDLMSGVVAELVVAVGQLAIGMVSRGIRRHKTDLPASGQQPLTPLPREALLVAIYPQASTIVSRIDGAAGIRGIELTAAPTPEACYVLLDAEAKQRIVGLKSETVIGPTQTLEGKVTRLFPASDTIEVLTTGNEKVRVRVSPSDFDWVRYQGGRNSVLCAEGQPTYRLGFDTTSIHEFIASSIELRAPV